MNYVRMFFSILLAVTVSACALIHAEEKVAKLVITKAVYGDLPDGAKSDVTEKVKGMANADGLSVAATNENFGDPAEGTVKKLKVEYTLDDKAMDQTVDENTTLSISLKPSKLKIIKALYGDLPDGPKTDVTAKVQLMVKDDALSVGASNENFGDPAEGVTKKLKIEYSFEGGASKTKEANENDTLAISNKGE